MRLRRLTQILMLPGILLLLFAILPGCDIQSYRGMSASEAIQVSTDQEHLWARMRIYQVMVAEYRDGDPARGYGSGYGPGHHRGDLRGIIEALPYIHKLGMNTLWLTPIFDAGADSNDVQKLDATGYYTHDYFRIDPHFGTLEDARELVDKAHALGLYVILDGVFGHHKTVVAPSPSGRLPSVQEGRSLFPQSTDFYKEVALYWIDSLNIDGWRLDQAAEVPLASWQEIRDAVTEKCADRKSRGLKWGTLGYMVAEIWSSEKNIARMAYGDGPVPVLQSAFDFPVRYRLVQTLAVEESGIGHAPATNLRDGFSTHEAYPPGTFPNLMLGNHDLVRFGDLIERAGYPGRDHSEYWQRHQSALTFMAAYSGPITLYYGDEYGDELPGFAAQVTQRCWESDRCDDHVSRTPGRIDGFDEQESALVTVVQRLMRLRDQHPALWAGERRHLYADHAVYADLKTYADNHILLLMNTSQQQERLELDPGIPAQQWVDLVTREQIKLQEGIMRLPLPPVSARLLLAR